MTILEKVVIVEQLNEIIATLEEIKISTDKIKKTYKIKEVKDNLMKINTEYQHTNLDRSTKGIDFYIMEKDNTKKIKAIDKIIALMKVVVNELNNSEHVKSYNDFPIPGREQFATAYKELRRVK